MEQLPLEWRPRMLKDFLLDDSNSSSSSGFKSSPRTKSQDREPCAPNLTQIDLNSNRHKLQRSRSKAAARKLSAFQLVINAVKNIHFATVKSPTFFSRSLSQRNSNRVCHEKENEVKIRVITIKDIMQWQSFCEFVDEKSPPPDFAPSPQHCTTTTTTPSSSNHSGFCESDYTSEYLPEESGENNLQCVGEDSVQTTTVVASESAVGPKGELDYEEEEQQSPVSVLGFQYEEDEEPISSFNQSLAHMERAKQKLMQRIRHFEETVDWVAEDMGEIFIRDVGIGRWSKFEEEQEGLAFEVECGMVNYLVDELLGDLLLS
ncbi:hypothetical protein SLA2020_178420 [Shorea laevis]